MGRPLRQDRSTLVDSTISLRLTRDDRTLLDQLVRLHAARLRGEGIAGSAASYVRSLIRREAVMQGLVASAPGVGRRGASASGSRSRSRHRSAEGEDVSKEAGKRHE